MFLGIYWSYFKICNPQPGWASKTAADSNDRRKPKRANNKKPKKIITSAMPTLRNLVSLIRSSPRTGTNKKPMANGVGIRKSIICLEKLYFDLDLWVYSFPSPT